MILYAEDWMLPIASKYGKQRAAAKGKRDQHLTGHAKLINESVQIRSVLWEMLLATYLDIPIDPIYSPVPDRFGDLQIPGRKKWIDCKTTMRQYDHAHIINAHKHGRTMRSNVYALGIWHDETGIRFVGWVTADEFTQFGRFVTFTDGKPEWAIRSDHECFHAPEVLHEQVQEMRRDG